MDPYPSPMTLLIPTTTSTLATVSTLAIPGTPTTTKPNPQFTA